MDELVHHCLRELSFDGDLGCDVSRLKDFIVGFYSTQDGNTQLIDDTFCAFVWSVIVQQPSVRVGTLPPGLTSEVYIAPQVSAKRKAAAKGEEVPESVPPSLELVEDACHWSLDDLKREYGSDLRIAVDPETSFAAITGSHIRPPKLSPMVYSALQLITRGREEGVTTVELGRKTQYDQKTCFYLIKQLIELGLIIKARRGGVGNHTCIHKYFVERSPLWQQIQEEEARDDDVVITGESIKPSEKPDEAADQGGPSQIIFDPIDSRHLSSLTLLKNRIVKLLKSSRNQIHPSNNLLMAIGFMHPTKTDRRFFQTRLRELIQQGIVERVLVPSLKTRDRMVKCIRLVTSDNELPEGTIVVNQEVDEDEKDVVLGDTTSVGHTEVKANLTIHKQVSKLLEEAGSSGLTLNEICASLGNFDKRTIELLLTRASKSQPPGHLGDLGIVDLMETYGRERRHRYFTVAACKTIMSSERLQDTGTPFADVDLSRVGDFAECDPNHFYGSVGRLHGWQDSFKEITIAKNQKRKRDEDGEGSGGVGSEPPPQRKRGRPRKTPASDASSTVPRKRGRPRKNPVPQGGEGGGEQSQPTEKVPRKRGRPPKSAKSSVSSRGKERAQGDEEAATPKPKRRRVELVLPRITSRSPSKRSEAAASDVPPPPNYFPSTSAPQPSTGQTLAVQEVDGHTTWVDRTGDNSCLQQTQATPVSQRGVPVPSAVSTDQGSVQGDGVAGEKHKAGFATPSRPSKRARTEGGMKSRANINISALRRENELYKVIEDMGGIVNMHSKDIFDAHTALLDTMSQAKEPSSAPAGTRLDKRTAESSLKNLENRGRLKMLKTSLVTPSGATKPACLVYLPETPQEKINDFLRQLTRTAPSATPSTVKTFEEPIEYGTKLPSAQRTSLPLHLLQIEDQDEKEDERLNQLSSYDGNTIRGERTAIKETQLSSKKIISQLKAKLPHGAHIGPPPLVPNPPEKSVELLIAQQGPPAQPTTVKKKGKVKAKEETDEPRRPRFHWTREFDELARDASAIVRARCRDTKLDFSAFDQVFPVVPRNSVRQRVMHLRENATDDLYLKRLEDQWYLVWLQYRGSPHLPDEDPSSSSNFNLIHHVEFLRKHVDKNALRVGFVEREAPSKLAASIEDLYDRYDIEEDIIAAPAWDFLWSTTVEEGREKQFLRQAFTKEPDQVSEGAKNESVQLAEAALRMVFGTPGELYDSENATRLLHSAGDQSVSVARSNLLHQGVLSKLVRDPKKPKPGRTLKISDSNLNAVSGPFPRDLFHDATSLEDVAVERVVDEMEWPLGASEGEAATLLQLVCEDQLDFTIDLSHTQAARPKIDWNSKRADDDDIETSIRLKFSRISVQDQGGNENQLTERTSTEPSANAVEQETHEGLFDRSAAVCALETSGLVNCSACINAAFGRFISGLDQPDCMLARRVFDQVRSSKEKGLTKAGCLALESGSEPRILDLAHRMTLTSPPILFWTYFNTPTLVAADHWDAWSVTISADPLRFVSPRRWLDLRGHRLDSAWRAALRAVVGIIFLHSGISQAELRWRMRAVYDRQEVIDLLSSLEQDGILHCRIEPYVESVPKPPGWLKTLDNDDVVFWFISKHYHWYQI